MPFARLREIVGLRAGRGESLGAIDAEVIEPSGLDEEQKAALWLYGWAGRESGRFEYKRRQDQLRRNGANPRPSPIDSA